MDIPVLGAAGSPGTIGPYVLTRKLGAGGMAEVWIGERTANTGASKRVAVKILDPRRAKNDAYRRLFDEEARLSMLLNNSNIVQVFDVGEDAGTCYMGMEWIDGLDLDELMSRVERAGERFPLTLVGYVIGEVLKALAYAHGLEHDGVKTTIIHRDISPHNVMLSVAGEVKVMDFGIARVASEETSGLHVKGKLRYMPPEQLRSSSKKPTIDLFAVGGVLHGLLDGKKFRSVDIDEDRLMGMVFDGEIPPLSREAGYVPPELEALRRGLLEANEADRIQTAREAHRWLSNWGDYRDAKFELQDFVRRFVKPSARAVPERTTDLSRGIRDAADAVIETGVDTRSAVILDARSATPVLVLLFAVVGLGVGVLGVGVMLISRRAPQPRREVVEVAEVADVVEVPEPAPPEPPLDLPSEPRPPAPVAQVAVEQTPTNTPPAAKQPARVPRVPVRFLAPGKFYVEVKVAGKTFTVERIKGGQHDVKLKPGRYAITYREDPKSPFRAGGSLSVEDGDSQISVELQGSGTFTVK